MREALANLLWLQARLTRAIFRPRTTRERLRALAALLQAAQLLLSAPLMLGLGAGAAVLLAWLPEGAATGLALLVQAGLTAMWLLTAVTYQSHVIERLNLTRLTHYPLSLSSLTVSSVLVGSISISGLATLPISLGVLAGLAWHRPLALPAMLPGAIGAVLVLLLLGRVLDDLFDLVAEDHRLRGLLMGLLMAPLLLLWLGQPLLQVLGWERIADLRLPATVRALLESEGPLEFLTLLGPGSPLAWLPVAWPVAAQGSFVTGAWLSGAGYLALSALAVGGLWALHSALGARLMRGALLRSGPARVRSARWPEGLPRPEAFWVLVIKDLIYLRRNPMARRMIIMGISFTSLFALLILGIVSRPASLSAEVRHHLTYVLAVGWPALAGMVVNMQFTANYYGAADREGLATLIESPAERRYQIASPSLVCAAVVLVVSLPALIVSSLLGLGKEIVPLGLYAGVAMQLLGAPAYALTSILSPYRSQWQMTSQERGNLWGLLVWALSVAPVAALVLLPHFLLPAALWIALPVGLLMGAWLFRGTLAPLARLFQRRSHEIYEAVARES